MEQNKNELILVVDDEPEVHTVLGKMLQKEGYHIEHAYNGDETFRLIEEKKPDLIILDIMMPKISGIEVCNKLRSQESTKNILILIVSARDAQADRLEGLTHGADEYVSKPFHLKSLVRKIEHMIEKRKREKFEQELRP